LSIAQELTDAGTQRAAALEWRSRLLIGLREYTAAASCLEELLRDQAQAADALWLRAMIHVALGEDALADTICRELLGAHPAHADGWFLAAELSYARSDREQAYAALESGLARRPNDRHARLAMAWLAKEKGQDQQFAEIVSDIRQALPDHGESYTRALFAAITDDLTTARMWLDRATSFAPYLVDSKRLAIALTPLRLAEELIQQQTPS